MKRGAGDSRDFSKAKIAKGGRRDPHGGRDKGTSRAVDEFAKKLSPGALEKASAVNYTVSMAIPSSFLRSAQTRELKSYMVAQIARAAVLHEVDELVIFIDTASEAASTDTDKTPSVFLCRLLQYLECPAYLRKAFFPVHSDLTLAGMMPQLDTPHHMRRDNVSLYREGVIVEDKVSSDGCYANVGLHKEAFLPTRIRPGTRVTVKLDDPESIAENAHNASAQISGMPVPPNTPRAKHGLYWGYKTRLARSFHEIFTKCPYGKDGGYSFLVGQSEKGQDIDSVDIDALKKKHKIKDEEGNEGTNNTSNGKKAHFLVVFGGGSGNSIENCIDADETLTIHGKDADTMFDLWTNTCAARGSRQVRTEEAVQIGMTSLRRILQAMTAE